MFPLIPSFIKFFTWPYILSLCSAQWLLVKTLATLVGLLIWLAGCWEGYDLRYISSEMLTCQHLQHSVVYITCITKIKCPLHSKYINNKSKSGKTIYLSVCNRGRLIRVFLWPMLIFRIQGSRWPILDADFFGLICLADILFPLSLIKESLGKCLLQAPR